MSGETKADLLSPSGASGERGGSIHGIPNYKHGSVAVADRSPSPLERCEGSKGENSIAFASRVSGDANADLLSPSGASGERGGSNHDIPNYHDIPVSWLRVMPCGPIIFSFLERSFRSGFRCSVGAQSAD